MSTHNMTARFLQSQSLVNSYRLTAQNSLADHLNAFILYCRIKRLSPSTLSNYTYQIGTFVLFAERNNILRLCDVNKMQIQIFFLELGERNNGTSCRDYYKSIKRFFNWLVWDEVLEVSPMIRIELPKEETKIIQPFTMDHINKMLSACNPKYELGLRNKALILVFYYSAARRKEIAAMKVQDLDIEQGTIKVMGKGNKQRLVTISNKTLELLYQYIRTRKNKSEWLWLTNSGEPLTGEGIYQVITSIKAKVGIDGYSGVL